MIVKTGSRTLERAIKVVTGVSSWRLRINVACIKEMLKSRKIDEVL